MRDDHRDRLLLFGLALVVRLAVASVLTTPPYMDAQYYAAGALRLAEGDGLTEPFLWHYLDDPAGIPHPGFLYWMPLPSFLGAPFAALLPGSFFALQIPFALLSALLSIVSYSIARQTTGSRRHGWAAGLLTLFSGFFFPYWTLPETFAPYALVGSLAIWLAGRRTQEAEGRRTPIYLLIGALIGLAHLTRADGILLLPVVALAPLVVSQPRNTSSNQRQASGPTCLTTNERSPATHNTGHVFHLVIFHWSLIILGYLLVMGPWFLRNLNTIGTSLPSSGTKTLWLTNYDDFFCYGCDLSLHSYLDWGWGNILHSKLFALWTNFQRLLAENCLVFLLPFALIGLYRLRRHLSFALSIVYLAVIYLAHSLAFTYPGWRGGFFHSSGAILPFLYVAGMEGLDAVIRWITRRRRGWNLRQAWAVFTASSVVLAILLSLYVGLSKLPAWRNADQIYRQVEMWLEQQGIPRHTTIMVGSPPGFWYHTRRPAVVVPNGDIADVLEVARRYQAKYVLLDRNRPAPLAALYAAGIDSDAPSTFTAPGDTSSSHLAIVKTWGQGDGRAVLYAVKK